MGGAARIFRRVFSPPAYTPPPAQTVAAPVEAAKTVSGASKMAKVRGQGSGITGTIMTDATGAIDGFALNDLKILLKNPPIFPFHNCYLAKTLNSESVNCCNGS